MQTRAIQRDAEAVILMDLNDILTKREIDPETVLALRHSPTERVLNRNIAWLASEKPDVFNAYQSAQTPRVEAQMKRAKFVAAFIGLTSPKSLFVGLYANEDGREITDAEFDAMADVKLLKEFGHEPEGRGTFLWFTLAKLDTLSEWSGKLVVGWPTPLIQWSRWVGDNAFPVLSIHEESQLVKAVPDWRSMSFTAAELRHLPTSWQAKLAEWRGVYFIFDRSLNQGYVGAAYNAENIWGRWTTHLRVGGDAKKLKACDPINFVFSILERTSPDMEAKEVVALETTWKERLHTISHGLNDN